MSVNSLEKKIYDQSQLLRISKALNSDLNLSSLIESILDLCLAQVQTMRAGIYLYPEIDTNVFALHDHYIGFNITDQKSFLIQEQESIIRYMQDNGDSFELSQLKMIMAEMDKQFRDTIEKLSTLCEELLLIPMKSKRKIIGIIILGSRSTGEPYSEEDKDFLQHLTSIATTAVTNARLYALATIDMMTQLKMHHFFQMSLRENIQSYVDSDQKYFSIFLTDIDYFKKFNDTYGHQLGDLVLKEVAKKLIDSCRDSDIPCRYGGEEFVVILPNTGIVEALASAERARIAIENLAIPNPTDIGDRILKVTISAGVAEYDPKRDKEPKILIERSDKALYQAKHSGRNQVIKTL